LSARSRYAQELTNALKDQRVPKRDVPAHVARLLRRVVGNRFVDVWGPIDELTADKEALFAKYREVLTAPKLASADLASGQQLFAKTCSSCHLLAGTGGKIGPDITGANRGNLEYLLSNILTPSAIIQDDYRMHIILTDDGRIYSGIPSEENERTLKLHVADRSEPVLITKSSIESREIAAVSMMPDGILNNLSDTEVVDLVGYLQSVPASKAADSSTQQ
jgi:putative heme-binding domain-containing protein